MKTKEPEAQNLASALASYEGDPDLPGEMRSYPKTFFQGMLIKTDSVMIFAVLCTLTSVPVIYGDISTDNDHFGTFIVLGILKMMLCLVLLWVHFTVLAMLGTMWTTFEYHATIADAWYWRHNPDLRKCVRRPITEHEFKYCLSVAQKADRRAEAERALKRIETDIESFRNLLALGNFALEGTDSALIAASENVIERYFRE